MLSRYFKKVLDEADFSLSDKETVKGIGKFHRKQLDRQTAKEIIDGCREILNDKKLQHPFPLGSFELFCLNVTEAIEMIYANGKTKFKRVNYLARYGVDFNFLVKVFLHYHHRQAYGDALSKFFTMYEELKKQGLPYNNPEEFWEVFKTMKYYDIGSRDLDTIVEGYLVIRDNDMGIQNKKSPEYLKLCSACSIKNSGQPLLLLCGREEFYEDEKIFINCSRSKSDIDRYLVKEQGEVVLDAEYLYLNARPEGQSGWRIKVYKGGQWVPYLYHIYEKKYHKKIFIGSPFGDY